MMKTTLISAVLALAPILATNAFAAHNDDHVLADEHGCTSCHALTPQNTDANKLPIGPSFKEIADRFHANKDSDEDYMDLYRIVKHGSSPYRSKWRGKVSGLAMPPNDDTITDLEINRLLVWILTSDPH